jgi:hypothetical protein
MRIVIVTLILMTLISCKKENDKHKKIEKTQTEKNNIDTIEISKKHKINKIICDLDSGAKRSQQITLDDEISWKLKKLANNKVNYISGTMSPSDKSTNLNELESLEEGLLYFKKNNVENVILQKKYMGSRCQVYLSSDSTNDYAISRNGFKIKEYISNIFVDLHKRYDDYMKQNAIKLLIIDGELMPWYTLGKGLIEENYKWFFNDFGYQI